MSAHTQPNGRKQGLQYVDYGKLFSLSALKIKMPELRKKAAYAFQEGFICMGGGFPNPVTFPIVDADFKLRDGSVFHVGGKQMETHLQYGLSQGYPDLREWMIEFQRRVHSPPTLLDPDHPGHFDLVINNGSNESINLAFNLFLSEGEWALTEENTYPTVLSMMLPIGSKIHSVKTDWEGLDPADLDRVLTSWTDLHPGSKKPRVLYAITSGSNPTGVTWSLARRRAVYDVARSHDLMILEDDAYYFLQFNRPLLPSLLSMDVDGRVLRFDTFSKIVGPGLRVGTVSGPAPVLRKMRLQKDISSLTPSGLSQAMLVQLLRHWGHDGFLRHIDSVMTFYKERVQKIVQCARRHLAGLAEWNEPSGGMFLWIRVLGVKDSEVVAQKVLERGVILINGACFSPSLQQSPYLRLSCATVSEEECEKAFTILADVIKEEQAKGE